MQKLRHLKNHLRACTFWQKKVILYDKRTNLIDIMKRFAFLCGLVAAFLCLAQNAHAQYAGPIHRQGANLADMRGNILTDHEVLNLIGEQVYDETYVGACKQRKAGKSLIWGGIGGLVGGAVVYGIGFSKVADKVTQDSSTEAMQKAFEENPGSAAMVVGGTALMAVGAVALDAGIPLAIIGKKRLNWVADDYNARKGLAYRVGVTSSGVGFALNF